MPSPDDERALPRVQAEFARINTEFPRWMCWPDGSGKWYALELGFWFRDTGEIHLFWASSPAGLHGFEDHARAWQALQRAAGLPPADPPVPDLPPVRPAALNVPALIAAMNEAASVLSPDPVAGLPLPGQPAPEQSGSMLATPGGRPADGCRRHHRRPVSRRTGPRRAHREHP